MPGPEPNIWTTFEMFTPVHWVALSICIALIVGACWLGLLWRGTEAERRLRWAWGAFILVMQVPSNYYYLWMHWDLWRSLPLHFCDLAVLIAAFALLTDARWLKTLLYFWGIGLSTQGFIQPVVRQGLASGDFWYFWTNHLQIIGSAAYLIVVMRYRPVRRDFLTVLMVSLAYVAVILPFDLALGLNYGYIGNLKPRMPTLIDRLGPWPFRLYLMLGIAAAMFLALWAVWPVAYAALGKEYPPTRPEGRCRKCGYDLAGLPINVICPECGTLPVHGR